MNSLDKPPLPVGRVVGFRGNGGEVTVRVASGDAARWSHLRRVLLKGGGNDEPLPHDIEAARAYRDRLVLKFVGVNDVAATEPLRGCEVLALEEDVPRLPRGEYWIARLLGARVKEAGGEDLGVVRDVLATGGADVLVVEGANGRETLVPLAKEIVTEIDEAAGCIVVALPDGLRNLNDPERERS